jgi:type II secretory ATPase GspE/PulE/Tfp pilus assembly ATPase PilB-like protein
MKIGTDTTALQRRSALDPAVTKPQSIVSGNELRPASGPARIYPVRLAAASVYHEAIQLFVQWRDLTGNAFVPAALPWLPVGRVGPMLVLGHFDSHQPAPLPPAWFQPVRLPEDDYFRHLRMCEPILASAAPPDWETGETAAPRRAFPGCDAKLIRPTTQRGALRFLVEYFPHRRTDLQRIQEILLTADEEVGEDLPPGYAGACWVLLEKGGVVDPTVICAPEALVRRMPAAATARARVVAEHERNVWIAAERLPQPDVEDMFLNELGDGWQVHFLLLDAPRQIERSRTEFNAVRRSDGETSSTRRRVKIEDARSRLRTNEPTAEPGVIRMSQKEIRELESYNARRPDRDPLKVFLKELSSGIRLGATDLHIELGLDSYRIRARIDGYLEEWLVMPVEFGRMVVGAAKEQFGLPPERWLPQDGACTVFHGSEIVNLRVAAYPIRGVGQKIAIRYLPRRGEVPALDALMPAPQAALLRRAITRPYGLILLCGPTGSGKTTTSFSALAEINSPEVNITTMEDPVEYEMDGVNQAELDRARGVDWDVLLAGFLRQDPDVGMVGEIRDRQTAETAIRLTLTGHIVFATLHTMSCAHTVERLVDSGVNAQMFANAATLIVSQRLVRRLCRSCRERGRRRTTEAESALFTRHGLIPPPTVCEPNPSGCNECRGTGYRGQVGAFEMLPITEDVAQMIAEKRPVREVEDWMRQHRFPRVFQSALALVADGQTTLAEANQWQGVWDGFFMERNPEDRT